MADAVAETGSAVVIMHNREEKDPAIDILDDVERFFERSLNLAAGAGVPFGRILLDPGVGFGKTRQQNHACIWNLDRFRRLGAPILVGLSRKSFIGGIIDAEVDRRLPGTLAADTIALMRGASVLRVHDVVENRAALAVFMALKRRRRALARGGARGRRKSAHRPRARRQCRRQGREPAPGAARAREQPGVELTAVSRFYRTPPWGKTDQDWFLNACALGRTNLKPEALLERVKSAGGRARPRAHGAVGAAGHRHRPHRL